MAMECGWEPRVGMKVWVDSGWLGGLDHGPIVEVLEHKAVGSGRGMFERAWTELRVDTGGPYPVRCADYEASTMVADLESALLEVSVNGRWVKVTWWIFRSWSGGKRLNGMPWYGPSCLLGAGKEATHSIG